MSKNNIILDLDHTIISCISITDKKSKLIPNLIQKFPKHVTLSEHNIVKYYIFPRNNLESFLDYIFSHFNVSIWTSASRRYCSFIINNFLQNRPIKYIFFDYHTDLSKKYYNHPKHLDLLINNFKISSFNYNNTIIIDNNKQIANNSLPYKSFCCTTFDIVNYINNFTNDNELITIINHLSSTFHSPLFVKKQEDKKQEEDKKEEDKKEEPVKQEDFVKQNLEEYNKKEGKNEVKNEVNKNNEEVPRYESLGWKKVESRSRPGEFSYENIHTCERIQDVPKYEARNIPEKSKDLEEYD